MFELSRLPLIASRVPLPVGHSVAIVPDQTGFLLIEYLLVPWAASFLRFVV